MWGASMTMTVPSTYRRQFSHERQRQNSTHHLFNLYTRSVLAGSVAPVHVECFSFSKKSFLGEEKKSSHREASALANELQEESEQFRFLRAACYANIKGSVGLILAKASAMRISIPLDLSSRPFIPLPRFMRSRRAASLLAPSLVFTPRRFA